MQSFPGRGAQTNPYLLQLVDALPPEVQTSFFSWRGALTARIDVLHVHWPDRFTRGSTPARTVLRRVAFAALLLRLRFARIAVVRTVHNVREHEQGDLVERLLLRAFDRLTTLWIRLNPRTPVPARGLNRLILHGHYRDVLPPVADGAVPGRILFFGLVRPYKGVEELVDAFADVAVPGASLRIVGRPLDDVLAARITALAASDARVTLRLEHLTDAELARELAEAELVVLPYRDVHNSGAALLALSAARPVLMPDRDVTRALADEIGEDWVLRYPDPLDPGALEGALGRAGRRRGAPGPRMHERDWPGIGAQHLEAYRAAKASVDARGLRR